MMSKAIKLTYRRTGTEFVSLTITSDYSLRLDMNYVHVTGMVEGDRCRIMVPRENVISVVETL